jgi:DNA replication protein DnaD
VDDKSHLAYRYIDKILAMFYLTSCLLLEDVKHFLMSFDYCKKMVDKVQTYVKPHGSITRFDWFNSIKVNLK